MNFELLVRANRPPQRARWLRGFAAVLNGDNVQLGHAMEDYVAAEPPKRPALARKIVADLDELAELVKQMELEVSTAPARPERPQQRVEGDLPPLPAQSLPVGCSGAQHLDPVVAGPG